MCHPSLKQAWLGLSQIKKTRLLRKRVLVICAEEEGFEPPVPCGTTVFKTAAFDHSAIPPGAKLVKKYNVHMKKRKIVDVYGAGKEEIVKIFT